MESQILSASSKAAFLDAEVFYIYIGDNHVATVIDEVITRYDVITVTDQDIRSACVNAMRREAGANESN